MKNLIVAIMLLVSVTAVQADPWTWLTRVRCNITGKETIYECAPETMPPNCPSVSPPSNIGDCGNWETGFNQMIILGTCPPNAPLKYRYYLTDSINGGFDQVGMWSAMPDGGSCANGFYSNKSLTMVSPNCD